MQLTLPHIGMRIVKTGLSVTICLALGHLFSYSAPIYACVAAIIVTKDTIENSFKQGVDRVVSTLVGGAIAILILLLGITDTSAYLEVVLVGVGCILTLYFCVVLKNPDAAALACVVFLTIVLQHPQDKYIFALTRVGETIVGIVISLLVNRLVKWPFGKRAEMAAAETDQDTPAEPPDNKGG